MRRAACRRITETETLKHVSDEIRRARWIGAQCRKAVRVCRAETSILSPRRYVSIAIVKLRIAVALVNVNAGGDRVARGPQVSARSLVVIKALLIARAEVESPVIVSARRRDHVERGREVIDALA